jgi:hypothetical protein
LEQEYLVPLGVIKGKRIVDHLFDSLASYNFQDGIPAFCFRGGSFSFLRNGARAYIDLSTLLEITTPECKNAFDVVRYDKASEIYAYIACDELRRRGITANCWKTNIASFQPADLAQRGYDEYATIGTHESYLAKRKRYVGKERLLANFLLLRQVFTGAGGFYGDRYVISPRMMFPSKLISPRHDQHPILSSRDEPHASSDFFRIHITCGEGVRSEITCFLRNSITSYVISAIEDGKIRDIPTIDHPLREAKRISWNTQGDWKVCCSGKKVGVIDYLNRYYLDPIEELFQERRVRDHDRLALSEFKFTLEKLRQGLFEDLTPSIEWILKERAIECFFKTHQFEGFENLSPKDKKIAIAYQLSEVGHDDLFEELERSGLEKISRPRRITNDEQIKDAVLNPPPNSRAEARVKLARKFRLTGMNWERVYIAMGGNISSIPLLHLDGWNKKRIEELLKVV